MTRIATKYLQSGGKFDGGKSADQQPRAEYFTELMTVGMAKQYTWHVKLAINVLRTSRVETEISCHTMTAVTHQALQNVYRSGQFDISYSEQLARSASQYMMQQLLVLKMQPFETCFLHLLT